MHIQLNGEQQELPQAATIATLIEKLGLNGRRLAVEVNEDIVPRSLHSEHRLNDGDRVEVVHAIGGG
ncbi:sulfur carrier protein ThiS [Marinobacter fonticola]|uniref:sulfur carrier protein ThiS n=1 Tax=Marinobacter fonticola TaxID=2603215 RepID=UPI0011E63C50|nr:sulfur carrier protein ThiS [Marinobacter fonticola]